MMIQLLPFFCLDLLDIWGYHSLESASNSRHYNVYYLLPYCHTVTRTKGSNFLFEPTLLRQEDRRAYSNTMHNRNPNQLSNEEIMNEHTTVSNHQATAKELNERHIPYHQITDVVNPRSFDTAWGAFSTACGSSVRVLRIIGQYPPEI